MDGRDLFTVIVGTGFSGLAAAVELRKLGIEDFVLLERGESLGGTWRDNVYPGCACDVPSHLYSFSFAPKHDWTRSFAPQPEIRAYLERVADDFDLRRHMRFGMEVVSAAWDDTAARWTIRTRSGEELRAKTLVMGTGALSNPDVPSIPGMERFTGPSFHSARWNASADLAGKRVAVIGTGASAIQIVPAIQPRVAKLVVLQRTAPWVLPRLDRPYLGIEKWAMRWIPGVRALYRYTIYWQLESGVFAFVSQPALMKLVEWIGRLNIRIGIRDPALREKLRPPFKPGCKRLLLSDDYYPALAKPNVEVVTDPIAEIRERSIALSSGREIEVDAIVFGTGFKVHDYLGGIEVTGHAGKSLSELYGATGAQAWLGTMIVGFPNLFIMMGPNTGLGHNSMIVMIEGQAHLAAQAFRLLRDGAARAVEPKPEVQAAFNEWIHRRSARTVWHSGCSSWYLDPKGRNVTLWPWLTVAFRRRTDRTRTAELALEK
jgi:cation diffusion facilitator CzcD-associated flavoprotein CzcO